MSISVLRSARSFFSVMAVIAFSAMVLVGCGKDDDDDNTSASLDSKLICADGEAWLGTVMTGQGPYEAAVILKGDKSLVLAFKMDGTYYGVGTGTWSTNGSNLTTTITMLSGNNAGTPETNTGACTVSGDGKATMSMNGEQLTVTKTKGITVQEIPNIGTCLDMEGNPIECRDGGDDGGSGGGWNCSDGEGNPIDCPDDM